MRLNITLSRLQVRAGSVAVPAAEVASEVEDETATAALTADGGGGVVLRSHALHLNGDPVCAVTLAPIGASASLAQLAPLAATLNVTGSTSGADAAASLAPLLASGAWDGRPLLVVAAADAAPEHAALFARLWTRLDSRGKAAYVADCDCAASGHPGRRIYLLPAGRVANSVLAGMPSAAAIAPPQGSLIALVFEPSSRALPSSIAAFPPTAVQGPRAPPPAEAATAAPRRAAASGAADGSVRVVAAAALPAPAPLHMAQAVLDGGHQRDAGDIAERPASPTGHHCISCGLMSGWTAHDRTKDDTCFRCGFFPTSDFPGTELTPDRRACHAQFVDDLVAVLRSTPARRLPVTMTRPSAQVKSRRSGAKPPLPVARRFGTLSALLAAHPDIFDLQPSGGDACAPGLVSLRPGGQRPVLPQKRAFHGSDAARGRDHDARRSW